jgi:hypothetical protein
MNLFVVERLNLLIVIASLNCLTSSQTLAFSPQRTKANRRVHCMMTKPTAQTMMDSQAIESTLDFVQLTLQLKQTLRTGWVLRGVPRAESVADHSWHVALLSLFLLRPDSSLDVVKCAQVKE